MRFDGKTVFVTGGARGIGEALANAFVEVGARVAIADLDAEAVHATASRLGPQVLGIRCDVADRSDVTAAFAQAQQHFNGIDILVNNAGLHTRHYNRPVTVVPEDAWSRLLAVNIMGLVNCASVAAPLLSDGGVILNMGSVSGFEVCTAYGVTKLAVRGLTAALAQELASQGTRVNAIAPGLIHTATILDDLADGAAMQFVDERQLIKRSGMPADLIGAVLFLCSEQASFITGETLIIGGGYARRV